MLVLRTYPIFRACCSRKKTSNRCLTISTLKSISFHACSKKWCPIYHKPSISHDVHILETSYYLTILGWLALFGKNTIIFIIIIVISPFKCDRSGSRHFTCILSFTTTIFFLFYARGSRSSGGLINLP